MHQYTTFLFESHKLGQISEEVNRRKEDQKFGFNFCNFVSVDL